MMKIKIPTPRNLWKIPKPEGFSKIPKFNIVLQDFGIFKFHIPILNPEISRLSKTRIFGIFSRFSNFLIPISGFLHPVQDTIPKNSIPKSTLTEKLIKK